MDQGPKCRLDAIKLLEENIGRTLFDINLRNIFSDPPSRIMKIKTKNKKNAVQSLFLPWSCIQYRDKATIVTRYNKRQIEENGSPLGP